MYNLKRAYFISEEVRWGVTSRGTGSPFIPSFDSNLLLYIHSMLSTELGSADGMLSEATRSPLPHPEMERRKEKIRQTCGISGR